MRQSEEKIRVRLRTQVDRVPEWSPDACVAIFWFHPIRDPSERPHHEEREKGHLHTRQRRDTCQGGGMPPYLDANSQRIKSISNISRSPELGSVNDAAFQHIKLYININQCM